VPTFFGRRYARSLEQVGRGEQVAGAVILLLTAGIVATFVAQLRTGPETVSEGVATDTRARSSPSRLLSFAPDGWRAPDKVDTYGPDALYQKIDGRADAFLDHGCVGLTFGTYTAKDNPERTVDVYVFEMRTPDDAEAVYRLEQPPEADAISLGTAGYGAGSAVFFYEQAYYVQVLPAGSDAADAVAAREIAARVADELRRGSARWEAASEVRERGAGRRSGRGQE